MKKIVIISLVTGFIFAATIYQYVNNYRFALLSGLNVSSAIDMAISGVKGGDGNAFFSFINRINGLDNFYVATWLSTRYQYDIFSIFDQTLGDSFNSLIFSGADVNTQFGLTQLGVFYAVGGIPLTIVGGFFLGLFMRIISELIFKNIFQYSIWAFAFMPLLALWFTKVVFAGGFLVLYLKEIILVSFMLYITRRYILRIKNPFN